jgi:DNA-binding NarL/FixJ family response regulator
VTIPDPIRVMIVEDDGGTRQGLELLIDRAPGFRCVAAFASAEALLQQTRGERPHVVLVDIRLPGMPGTELVAHLRALDPAVAILMLTAYSDDDKVFTAICNGAQGYLLKNTPPTHLLDAIRDAWNGGSPISPGIARKVLDAFRKLERQHRQPSDLKPIEVRLLGLLADGHTYETAGRQLNMSINTVRSYIRSTYEKLQVHSKSAAVSKAMRSGIL